MKETAATTENAVANVAQVACTEKKNLCNSMLEWEPRMIQQTTNNVHILGQQIGAKNCFE